MKPLVFTGEARSHRGGKYTYFDLRANDYWFCHDYSLHAFGYPKCGAPAWGYYGKASKRLSVLLMGWSLCYVGISGGESNSWVDHPSLVSQPDIPWPLPHSAKRVKLPLWSTVKKMVDKHHDAFTKQVIAKLKPKWKMTSTQIKAWVKKQELKEKRKREKQTTKSTKAKSKARSKR